jgi:hypothetical protein
MTREVRLLRMNIEDRRLDTLLGSSVLGAYDEILPAHTPAIIGPKNAYAFDPAPKREFRKGVMKGPRFLVRRDLREPLEVGLLKLGRAAPEAIVWVLLPVDRVQPTLDGHALRSGDMWILSTLCDRTLDRREAEDVDAYRPVQTALPTCPSCLAEKELWVPFRVVVMPDEDTGKPAIDRRPLRYLRDPLEPRPPLKKRLLQPIQDLDHDDLIPDVRGAKVASRRSSSLRAKARQKPLPTDPIMILHDDANLFPPADLSRLVTTASSRPFDVVIYTTDGGAVPSYREGDLAVGSNVVAIGIDARHHTADVWFGDGVAAAPLTRQAAMKAGDLAFHAGRWGDGVEAVLDRASATSALAQHDPDVGPAEALGALAGVCFLGALLGAYLIRGARLAAMRKPLTFEAPVAPVPAPSTPVEPEPTPALSFTCPTPDAGTKPLRVGEGLPSFDTDPPSEVGGRTKIWGGLPREPKVEKPFRGGDSSWDLAV